MAGRGRGVAQLRQPNESLPGLRKPGRPSASAPVSEAQLPPSLSSLLKSAIGEILSHKKNGEEAAQTFNKTVTTSEDVELLGENVIDMCCVERAGPLATLCSGLAQNWQAQSKAEFRTALLRTFGKHYEKRAEIKATGKSMHGFTSFLAFLFAKLKIADKPPVFLAVPVVESMKDLVGTQSDMDSFLELAEEIGPLICQYSEAAVQNLSAFCRSELLADPCPVFKRLALLQVFELCLSTWKLPASVRQVYDAVDETIR